MIEKITAEGKLGLGAEQHAADSDSGRILKLVVFMLQPFRPKLENHRECNAQLDSGVDQKLGSVGRC